MPHPNSPISLTDNKEKLGELVKRIQFGGDEVVKAKDGLGSATLSMAYAGYRFANSLIDAKFNNKPTTEMAYVYIKDGSIPGAANVAGMLGEGIDFFSLPCLLGPEGVEKVVPVTEMTDYEKGLLGEALGELKGNIAKGIAFVEDAKL